MLNQSYEVTRASTANDRGSLDLVTNLLQLLLFNLETRESMYIVTCDRSLKILRGKETFVQSPNGDD